MNGQDAAGWTPLHYACQRGRLDVARWLVLLAHAAVQIPDKDGETPLHKLQALSLPAASSYSKSLATTTSTIDDPARNGLGLARLLIEQGGADPRATNHDGETLLDLLERQHARSTSERVLSWIQNGKKAAAADSYADFAESDYELESNYNASSCAYTALSLSRFHVDTEGEADEYKHWYDVATTTVGSETETEEGSKHCYDSLKKKDPKEKKITAMDWISYLKPLTKKAFADNLKVSLTPDTSLDEDDDLLFDLDNSALLGGMLEI